MDYENEIKGLKKNKSINCVAMYESLVRDEIKSILDLDVRIIRIKGIINDIKLYFCSIRKNENIV